MSGVSEAHYPFVTEGECRRCRGHQVWSFVYAWRDKGGTRWARYRCRQGHEDYSTVTRQVYEALAVPAAGGREIAVSESDGILRVFPRRTKWTPDDAYAFVGDPPLLRPSADAVHVSVSFTWDIPEARRLLRAWSQYYPGVRIGGPALGDPGVAFTPGRYIKEGVVFTSRGCPKRCDWCFVPTREGLVRELPITDGWIVQDNNLLACSRGHIEAVFAMLGSQQRGAIFAGGLDTGLLRDWHRDLLDSISLGAVWVASDSPTSLCRLRKAAEILDGIPIAKRRCYVLIGFGGESLADAESRLETVFALGFLPFAQLYRDGSSNPTRWPREWRELARRWTRPAAYRQAAELATGQGRMEL